MLTFSLYFYFILCYLLKIWTGTSWNHRGTALESTKALHVSISPRHWRQTECHRSNVISGSRRYDSNWSHATVLQVSWSDNQMTQLWSLCNTDIFYMWSSSRQNKKFVSRRALEDLLQMASCWHQSQIALQLKYSQRGKMINWYYPQKFYSPATYISYCVHIVYMLFFFFSSFSGQPKFAVQKIKK